jgi:hypothetical protein
MFIALSKLQDSHFYYYLAKNDIPESKKFITNGYFKEKDEYHEGIIIHYLVIMSDNRFIYTRIPPNKDGDVNSDSALYKGFWIFKKNEIRFECYNIHGGFFIKRYGIFEGKNILLRREKPRFSIIKDPIRIVLEYIPYTSE